MACLRALSQYFIWRNKGGEGGDRGEEPQSSKQKSCIPVLDVITVNRHLWRRKEKKKLG
jgi:hypothetical protein